MLDRQWIGDVALAVLLVLPATALPKAQPADQRQDSGRVAAALSTDHSPAGRPGLLG